MAELTKKRNTQPTSRPDGWHPSARVVLIQPTTRQERYTKRAVGIARFVYNRMVANDQDCRDQGLWLTPHELEKEFNTAKHLNPDLKFVNEVSKFVAQGACRNYRSAYHRWRNTQLKARKPRFHKKNRNGTGSFLAASGINTIKYDGHRRIRLPYLGSMKMTRSLPEGTIPYEVNIKKRNGRWYASVAFWSPPAPPPQRETQSAGGVDVGINPLAADSDGTQYQNPKALYRALRKLARWQRAQARRTPDKKGWWQAQHRIDSVHRRITGLRSNAHHQTSRALVDKYHTLGIESLNVTGMIKAGLQAKALSDAAMSDLLRQISYKAERSGTHIVEASHWYPSSKTCSGCGHYNQELQRQPTWTCPACNSTHDRNLNAARNLLKLALLAVGEDVTLPNGTALTSGDSTAGETAPNEGRTKPSTPANTSPHAGNVTVVTHLEYPSKGAAST